MGLLSWFGSKLGETVEKIGDTIGNATVWNKRRRSGDSKYLFR